MLLGTKKNLYDHIIEGLLSKDASVSSLQDYLQSRNTKATVQGIYKALRELIEENIVVKQKKMYSINNIWREKVSNLFSKKYQFGLSPGEMVVYTFTKLIHLDAFWKHTLNDLVKETGDFPSFDYVPHLFWSYLDGRKESELEYFANYDTNKTYLFSILGGTDKMDKLMKEKGQTTYRQIHLDNKSPFSRRDNMTIMGNYIITTRIALKLSKDIDAIYSSAETEEILEQQLNALFKSPGPIKLTVEHNTKKAKQLRKRMAADFYIPKELHEKFDLF